MRHALFSGIYPGQCTGGVNYVPGVCIWPEDSSEQDRAKNKQFKFGWYQTDGQFR